MSKVRVNDINMYYDVQGEGFPLVMVMGFLGNANCWDPRMLAPLSDKFKVLVLDNRGAGRTDISDREYSIKLFAEDTVGLMDALNIPRAHVLGISMGGMIAQEVALNYPKRVEKLVLASTFCGGAHSVLFNPDDLEQIGSLLEKLADRPRVMKLAEEAVRALGRNAESPGSRPAATLFEAMGVISDIVQDLLEKGSWDRETALKLLPNLCTEEFIRANPGIPGVVVDLMLEAPTPIEGLLGQVKAIAEFDACPRLPKIKIPTLVMAGERDVFILPENSQTLADRIPGARLAFLANSGHMFMEDMDEATGLILEFLS
jgi:pimeloyl-ACP methyl ester carboxylesterase